MACSFIIVNLAYETFLRSHMEFDCRSYYMTAKEIGKVSDLGHVKEVLPLELESLIQMVCENIELVIAPSLFFGKQGDGCMEMSIQLDDGR